MDILVQAALAGVVVVVYDVVKGQRDRLREPKEMALSFAVAFFLIGSTYGLLSGQAQRDCEARGGEWVRSDPHGANGPGWECD